MSKTSDYARTVSDCSDELFLANNELMAITQLMDTEEITALKMTEYGRAGLAAILQSIATRISAANARLPTVAGIEAEIERKAKAMAISMTLTSMAGGQEGDLEQ